MNSTSTSLPTRLRTLAATSSRPAPPQVKALAAALADDDGLENWAQVDLTLLPRPAPPASPSRGASLLMTRNALVFVPVALTWFAISRAIGAYRSLVSEGTALSNKSFLYLWETGMGGRLGFLERLSTVAFLDVAIIVGVIALTIAGDRVRKREIETRTAELDDLDDEWDGLLVEISLRLAEASYHTPTKFKDALGATAAGLERAARATREAAETLHSNADAARAALDIQVSRIGTDLTELIRTSKDTLDATASDISDAARQTRESAETLRANAEAARTSLDAQATLIGNDLAALIRDSGGVVQRLGAVSSEQTARLQELATAQQAALESLGNIEEAFRSVAPALADTSEAVRRGVEAGTQEFAAAARALRGATDDSSALLAEVSDRVRQLVEAVAGAEDLAAEVAILRKEVVAATEPLRTEASLLNTLVGKQQEAAETAEEIADSLQRVARSVEFGTGQLRIDLDEILEGLRTLAPPDSGRPR